MRSTSSVEINRPIDEVFEYTNNNVAEWSKTVISDEPIKEKPGVVGSTFRTVTEERGTQMTFEGVVTCYEPPNKSVVYLTGATFDIEAETCSRRSTTAHA